MGGNVGLGALAGGAAGFIGGAVGGRLADAWDPGLARIGAGIATAAGGGAAGAAIAGGSPGTGAALGAFGAVTVAIASGSLQQALDAGRAKAGAAADGPMATKVVVEKSDHPFAARQTQVGNTQPADALSVDQVLRIVGRVYNEAGFRIAGRLLGLAGNVLGANGDGAMIGGIVGAGAGAGFGAALGTLSGVPGGSVMGGILGALKGGEWGSQLGSSFDAPDAGSLNVGAEI